jgi:hypothetical protein
MDLQDFFKKKVDAYGRSFCFGVWGVLVEKQRLIKKIINCSYADIMRLLAKGYPMD